MTIPSSDVLVRPDFEAPVLPCWYCEGKDGDGQPYDPKVHHGWLCEACDERRAAAEKIETLEKERARLRELLVMDDETLLTIEGTLARAEKAEARVKELEEAFSRVSDEGDALSAEKEGHEHDLVILAEKLTADLTRAREEAGALRERLREQKAYWQRVIAHDTDKDGADRCFDVIQEEAGAAIVLIDAALSGSTSTEHPTYCGGTYEGLGFVDPEQTIFRARCVNHGRRLVQGPRGGPFHYISEDVLPM